MGNERLRTAMAKARVDIEAVTNKTGVDPKTVQRWLDGRVPYARHRWAISALVNEDETYLWPRDDQRQAVDRSQQGRAGRALPLPVRSPGQSVVGPVQPGRAADRCACPR